MTAVDMSNADLAHGVNQLALGTRDQLQMQPHPPAKSKSGRRPVANGFLPSLNTHFENGIEGILQSPMKSRRGGFPEVLDEASKTCYFYHDGQKQYQNAVKLAVKVNRYKKIDALLNELTERMPDLTFGVRAIYTPTGMHAITSVDQLANEGRYVCSSNPNRVKGVDIQKLARAPRWSNARPPSGRRLYSISLRLYKDPKKKMGPSENYHSAPPVLNGLKDVRIKKDCKKLYVRRMNDPKRKHVYLLNTKSTTDFEDLLIDLSTLLQSPVHNVYTMTGTKVTTVAQVFDGPNEYYAETGEWHPKKQPHAFMPTSQSAGSLPLMHRATDGLLHATARKRKSKKTRSKNRWQVLIKTGEEEGAGTTANVSLVVYGENGKTQRRFDLHAPLNTDTINAFQDGSIDTFELSLNEITKIYKIRLEHDEMGLHPLWYVDSVTMKSDSGVQLEFECSQWLARDLRDCESFCELPAAYPGEPVPPVISYLLTVYTGSAEKAGTKAQVFVQLFGDKGDTGKRELLLKLNNPLEKPFQQGSVDKFCVRAVDLGKVTRIIVGHNADTPGNGWFLDKLIITSEDDDQHELLFIANRWLDKGEGDGKIELSLDVFDEESQERAREAELWVFEKWKFQPGNVVRFYSSLNQLALRVHSDKSADLSADDSEVQSLFLVASRRGNSCAFKSYFLTESYLYYDAASVTRETYTNVQPCSLNVCVRADRSVQLEADLDTPQRVDRYLTLRWTDQTAKMTAHNEHDDTNRTVDPPPKFTSLHTTFTVHCKGAFRAGNVIMFSTAARCLLTADASGQMTASSVRSRAAHFRVLHPRRGDPSEQKRVRLLESVAYPDHFLRIVDGLCDCTGTSDSTNVLLRVNRHKPLGYITLESQDHRGLFVGLDELLHVRTTQGDDSHAVRLYPEVVSWADQSNRSDPPTQRSGSSRAPSANVPVGPKLRPKSPHTPSRDVPDSQVNILSLNGPAELQPDTHHVASPEDNGNHDTDIDVPEEHDHGHFELLNLDPSSLEGAS